MADNTYIIRTYDEAPALAGASSAVRSEQPGGDAEDLEDADISQIQHGGKAVTGKALWSANSAARQARDDANHNRDQDEKKQELQEARELAHLAAWNGQMTTLGGVAMTNAEAQDARQHIIDHADHFADKAAREGRIREDEKEEYIRSIHRIRELEEKRGRGTSTAADERECERLKQSRAGQAAEHDAGDYHANRNHELDASTERHDSKTRIETGADIDGKDLFQSAPDATAHFRAANAATDPLQGKPGIPPPSIPTRDGQQTGFNLT